MSRFSTALQRLSQLGSALRMPSSSQRHFPLSGSSLSLSAHTRYFCSPQNANLSTQEPQRPVDSTTASSSTTSPASSPTPPTSSSPRFEVDAASFHAYSVQDLMRARVHMGHRTKLWHPKMAPYLLGHRNGMHIIDLDKTVPLLRRALTAVSLMAEHDCTFLWLGPRDVQKTKIIEKEARKAGAYTIDGARWIGGTLTNPMESNQVKRFNYRIPDCLFVVDVNRHMPALREAQLVGIPTIGIADSDCNPSLLTYPIPGNDDNALAIFLYCSLMKYAILDGRRRGRRLKRPTFKLPDLSSSQPSRRSRPHSRR